MGEYLSQGICVEIVIEKSIIESQNTNIEDLEEKLKEEVDLSLYFLIESDEYFIWELKEEYFEKEKLKNFLKDFYEDYFVNKEYKERVSEVFEKIENCNDKKEIIELALNKRMGFQMLEYDKYLKFGKYNWKKGRFYFHLITLSLDGKIIIECYQDLLLYLEKIIRYKYEKYDISGSLKFMIG